MIRKMTAADWPAAAEIYGQGIRAGTATFTRSCPDYPAWDAAHLPECRLVFAAEDGEVLGFAALSPCSAREPYKGAAEISVYVEEHHHRQGIGKALLNALMAQARAHGFWSLLAVVFSANEASLALHTSCGFRIIGTREDIARDRFGVWQSTTLLEWRNDIR